MAHLGDQSRETNEVQQAKKVQQVAQVALVQRIMSACTGSLITSLLVTPFDVIRVRLQLQESIQTPQSAFTANTLPRKLKSYPLPTLSTPAGDLGVTACCRDVFNVPSSINYCVASHFDECAVQQYSQRHVLTGTWDGFGKIFRNEGAGALWRGLSPTLTMAIPANVIYFVGYDHLRSHIPIHSDTLAPLVAGAIARTMATSAISPIELFRTRLQSLASPSASTSSSSSASSTSARTPRTSREAFSMTWESLTVMVKQQGFASLWRGLTLTLWRDVPFSAVYWAGYENMQRMLTSFNNDSRTLSLHTSNNSSSFDAFFQSFIAGATAGSFAAFVTTPFDVGKTRRQVLKSKDPKLDGMVAMLREIVRDEGTAGLFKGLVPRMMKVSVSCAIMISIYEMGKRMSIPATSGNIGQHSFDSAHGVNFDDDKTAVITAEAD
ncbi:mitochondrial carrier domain-containing protein [Lipomyces oligophaga]|uniref:mitochondrial carrier domain-containing protein n=1 Tax=Lipomyces oligophaga TaxID=45792 RepID=UPI0034CDC8E0